jgi:hypothetical protein
MIIFPLITSPISTVPLPTLLAVSVIKSFMKSKTYDQQFFVQIARFDFQEKK